MNFNHLKLKRWPFTVVPQPELCDFIADREQVREDIEKLLNSLTRQTSSSIHPIWSWFGAGKTHTLFYLSNRASKLRKENISKIRTIYSEFPRNPSSFVDVYKSFAFQLDKNMLTDVYLEISTSPDAESLEKDLNNIYPDLVSALNTLSIGKPSDQNEVMRWLRAEPLTASECRMLGISKKITSSEESSRILIALIRMLGFRTNSRLVWLLDELQRIEHLKPRIRDEINTGLHSTFNACPTGFSMILSFSGKPDEKLPQWFSPELKDRIGRAKVLILPPMQVEDALKFIKDLLKHSRTPNSENIDPYFPFTEKTCRIIIDDIQKNSELKPRSIMHTFNEILLEADQKIEANEMNLITPEFAKTILSELVQL